MAQLKIVFWRDIPGQVVYRAGRRNTRLRLPPRFARAIERAAYRLKKHDEEALFEPWHDVAQPLEGNDVAAQARALVAQLDAQYSDEVLESLIRAEGVDARRGADA